MQNVVMSIPKSKFNGWQRKLSTQGMKSYVSREAGVSRVTIDRVLATRSATGKTIEKISKVLDSI